MKTTTKTELTAPKTLLTQLVDSMQTRAVCYDLAAAAHQREGTGATYRALEAARVARRAAADRVDAETAK